MSTKFVDSASISSYNVVSTREMSALHTMKEEVYDKDGSTSDANDKLDNMSMSEIEDMHGKKLNQLNPNSQDQKVLNDILNEHKHGNINREKYLSLIEEYSANKHFSEKTYGDLKTLGITVLTTNSHGIVAGIKHYANESMAVVDKAARGFSTVLKGGTYAVGTGYGMYDDLANNDKTVGEAIAHNGTSLAIGIGTATVMSAFGAPIVAGLAVGAGLGLLFEMGYNRNWFGIQTGLDKVGQGLSRTGNKIKDAGSWTKDKVGDAIQVTKDKAGEAVQKVKNKAGEVVEEVKGKAVQGTKKIIKGVGYAVSSHSSKVNPVNWGW